jgi:hypothetical protein
MLVSWMSMCSCSWWSLLSLSTEKDAIRWRWTTSGQYTVASAYKCQFMRSAVHFPAKEIWAAKAEPKCKFFAWLILHNKALTADNMVKKHWPCNTTCPLCFCLLESAEHLLTQCNYSEALWQFFAVRYGLPAYQNFASEAGPIGWVNYFASTFSFPNSSSCLWLFGIGGGGDLRGLRLPPTRSPWCRRPVSPFLFLCSTPDLSGVRC